MRSPSDGEATVVNGDPHPSSTSLAVPQPPSREAAATAARESATAWSWRRLAEPVVGVGAVIVFLVAWQVAVELKLVSTTFLTSPTSAARALGHLLTTPGFWLDMRVSGEEFGIGLGISLAVGVICGLLYGRYKYFRAAFQPFILTLNAMPQIALVPVFILVFGVGLESKVVLVVISAVTPIWLNTETGVRSTDQQLVRLARAYHASEPQILRTIYVPAALPSIISGVRVAVGKALIAIVVGELFAAVNGLGHSLVDAANGYDMPDMYAYLIVITVLGLLFSLLLNRVETFFRYR